MDLIKEAVKKTTTFIIVWVVVAVIAIAGAWFGCWQFVLRNQWITLPTTHYEPWQFLFAFDQAWAWLWYVNFPLWLVMVFIGSIIVGFIVAWVISR